MVLSLDWSVEIFPEAVHHSGISCKPNNVKLLTYFGHALFSVKSSLLSVKPNRQKWVFYILFYVVEGSESVCEFGFYFLLDLNLYSFKQTLELSHFLSMFQTGNMWDLPVTNKHLLWEPLAEFHPTNVINLKMTGRKSQGHLLLQIFNSVGLKKL